MHLHVINVINHIFSITVHALNVLFNIVSIVMVHLIVQCVQADLI